MAFFMGKKWTKEQLLSFVGDVQQIANVRPSVLSDGKADGTRAISINTGGGLMFTVLPGRGMDIPEAYFRGYAINFSTGTGIVSPAYYEEPGLKWLRTFFGGLLTTCGITNAGIPSEDEGQAFGLHGRISNAAAETIRWELSRNWKCS